MNHKTIASLETFVNAGLAAQAAVDALCPRPATLADFKHLSDDELTLLAARARALTAMADYESGRRDSQGAQAALSL